MTDIKLIHKSKKYADRIMDRINEESIREIVFECWRTAYAEGYEAARRQSPEREDMGR